MNINFKVVPKQDILIILPLMQKINTVTPPDILKERVLDMVSYNTYECVGVFDNDLLVGISGLWYSTRHYIGKSVEPDHVFIDEKYRGKN